MPRIRTNKLSIRVSPEEYKYFLALQRDSGLTQADFLIKLLDFWKAKNDQKLIKENN